VPSLAPQPLSPEHDFSPSLPEEESSVPGWAAPPLGSFLAARSLRIFRSMGVVTSALAFFMEGMGTEWNEGWWREKSLRLTW